MPPPPPPPCVRVQMCRKANMLASNAVARYAHSATIADDVGNLFAAALELRHGCRDGGHTPDLEFIPVECADPAAAIRAAIRLPQPQ